MTLSRVIGIIMREFYSRKLVLKFWVTRSRCSINKGDIMEVRVYYLGIGVLNSVMRCTYMLHNGMQVD